MGHVWLLLLSTRSENATQFAEFMSSCAFEYEY